MSEQYNPPTANVEEQNRMTGSGITTSMIDALSGTKPWVLLIGIVLLLSAVFMVIATIGIFIGGAIGVAGAGGGMEAAAMMGAGAAYAVFSLIYVLLGVFLIKYSSAIGRLLTSQAVPDMEDALNAQRKFWKVSGVLTAIMLVLFVLGFLAAIIIPIMNAV